MYVDVFYWWIYKCWLFYMVKLNKMLWRNWLITEVMISTELAQINSLLSGINFSCWCDGLKLSNIFLKGLITVFAGNIMIHIYCLWTICKKNSKRKKVKIYETSNIQNEESGIWIKKTCIIFFPMVWWCDV